MTMPVCSTGFYIIAVNERVLRNATYSSYRTVESCTEAEVPLKISTLAP